MRTEAVTHSCSRHRSADSLLSVHFSSADDSELIEEYDLQSSSLLLRKRRKPKPLGGAGEWECLQGEEAPGHRRAQACMSENSTNVRAPATGMAAFRQHAHVHSQLPRSGHVVYT